MSGTTGTKQVKRTIIQIDRERCNGCGQCVSACVGDALRLVDGKAMLVREDYCDGLGVCVGECPVGALTLVEVLRDAPAAAPAHAPAPATAACPSCPGMASFFAEDAAAEPVEAATATGPAASALKQWPIMLHLVPPTAPFFAGRELLVLATCVATAYPDLHRELLPNRGLVMACPKLDVTDPYVDKLTQIFARNAIPRVIVARMEVPCCRGLTHMVALARDASGRADLPVDEVVIGRDGALRGPFPV